MFVGAYWSQREESKEAAAARIVSFLKAISGHGEKFAAWYSKGRSRPAALQSPLPLDAASIASKLSVNRRDSDRQPILELGFRFSAWNGESATFSATVGSWNQNVRNSVVLDIGDSDSLSEDSCRAILEDMVRIFDPEHAVVTSDECLARVGATKPWEVGWFTYARGDGIRQHPFS